MRELRVTSGAPPDVARMPRETLAPLCAALLAAVARDAAREAARKEKAS